MLVLSHAIVGYQRAPLMQVTSEVKSVSSWYDSGVRIGNAAVPVVEATEPEEPRPPFKFTNERWEKKRAEIISSKDERVLIPSEILPIPDHLDGTLAADVGFDPLCLVALAEPTQAMLLDESLRTTDGRKAKLAKMSDAEVSSHSGKDMSCTVISWKRRVQLVASRCTMR